MPNVAVSYLAYIYTSQQSGDVRRSLQGFLHVVHTVIHRLVMQADSESLDEVRFNALDHFLVHKKKVERTNIY
jgi:hypothetical protein